MSSDNSLVCWKCGVVLAGLPSPLSRISECLACHAELHVCRLCRFHDPKLRFGCREERAEHVQDKQRANFCEYFQPRPGAFQAQDTDAADRARAELEKLFDGKPQT